MVVVAFNRLNLISATNYTIGGDVIISLNVEASDMALRGGFVAQEELIKKNFEKLLLELDSLKSKFPKNIETIIVIIFIVFLEESFLSVGCGLYISSWMLRGFPQ